MNYRSRLFGSGMFYKNALVIAVPIMLQQLIQSLVSLIDNFMVSGLGDVSMSGVNVAGQLLSLMLVGNSQAGPILDEAVKYIRIMFFAGIPVTISISIASSLRDIGKVRIPLYVTIAATLTNTILNWLLSGAVVFGLVMMAFGFGTTLIVPLVFGKLSRSAVAICRRMVILMAAFMPLWVYMNTQQAVARAGGDTAMGAYADSLLTLLVMIPMVILLGKFTMIGPVGMYGCVKLIDLIKVVIFHIWLKKERWLKNLTGMESTARS